MPIGHLPRVARSARRSTVVARSRRAAPPIAGEPARPFEPSEIEHVVVTIPARNEAATVAATIRSVDAAAGCGVPRVLVVVAADSCHDTTVEVAREVDVRHVEVDVLDGRWRSAGGARRAAAGHAMSVLGGVDAATCWLASTDADCLIPPDWIVRQLGHVTRGALAVAGIVRLDPSTAPRHLLAAFAATYQLDGGRHPHVHAANLGVRADIYAAAGGWSRHIVLGEDHHLWQRLRRLDVPIVQTTDVMVFTSARTAGRLYGGFASGLARLQRQMRGSAVASPDVLPQPMTMPVPTPAIAT